jgi:DNA (cytosine-5)-methyltransferase 1
MCNFFAGVEGFGLAGSWLGWQIKVSVEIDKFCQQIIKQHFPETIIHADIKETNFKPYNGSIDIVSGGFPCQTFSLAGKGAMDLSLWKEMLRGIQEINPAWVIAENVYGLVSRKNGMALEQVCADMEAEKFEVFPPVILPAASVNAPHKRERVFIVAYNKINRDRTISILQRDKRQENTYTNGGNKSRNVTDPCFNNTQLAATRKFASLQVPGIISEERIITNTKSCNGRCLCGQASGKKKFKINSNDCLRSQWNEWATISPVCRVDDGFPNRVDRIGKLGASIVPQVAFEIFKAIDLINKKIY